MDQCHNFQKLLSEFIDGEISSDEAARSLSHAGSCHECRTFLSTVLNIRPVSMHVFSTRTPKTLDAKVHTLIKNKNPQIVAPLLPLWKRRCTISYPIVVLVSAILIFLGVLLSPEFHPSEKAIHSMAIENDQPQILPTIEVRAKAHRQVK